MREKIARALLASESNGEMAWEDQPLVTRGAFLRDADAVLAAMREPTEAMLRDFGIHKNRMRQNWQDMIDAAAKA